MAIDTATLTVAAQPARVGTCQLCATDGIAVAAAAVVRHSRGVALQLAACDRCERALRRLTAALGSAVVAEPPLVLEAPAVRQTVASSRSAVVADSVVRTPARVPAAAVRGAPQLVSKLTSEVVSTDGRSWTVGVYGEPRGDGTWVGWLTFEPADGGVVRRTRQETSQPDRTALEYWATGLQPSYLKGAFDRAS